MPIPTFAEKDSQIKPLFLDIAIRRVVVILISCYQKYLSPIKGFSCAYRVLHRGESCSCYTKRTILQQDLITAISMSQQRFRACASANRVLMARRHQQVSDELNVVADRERNQQGKVGLFRRRKFLQTMMLGLTMPVFTQQRFSCCFDGCSGS